MHRYFILVSLIVWLASAKALAQSDPLCKSAGEGKPEVCVRFDNHGTKPFEGTDVDIDVSTDPDYPSVTLRNGTYHWRVWSVGTGNSVGDMGFLKTDASIADDFTVVLARPDGSAGAHDVSSIVLNPPYDHYGNLLESVITGNVAGDVFIKDDDGYGGELELEAPHGVDGDVTADLAYDVTIGSPGVGGDVDIAAVFGASTVDIYAVAAGKDILVDILNDDVTFRYGGSLDATSSITLGGLGDDVTIEIGYVGGSASLEGDILIDFDLDEGVTLEVLGDFAASTLTIDGDVGGDIIFSGDDDGSTALLDINGDLTSTGTITSDDDGMESDLDVWNLEGLVTIDGPLSGDITTQYLTGTLDVDGDLSGEVSLYFDLTGTVSIEGDLSGDFAIGDDFSGEVTIGDDFTSGTKFDVGTVLSPGDMLDGAEFNVASNSRGDFWVTGDVDDGAVLTLNKLGANGRVLVDGYFHGDLFITEDTNATSLIQIVGGLMSTASIVINAGEDNTSSANGDFFIGDPGSDPVNPVDPVEYDGVINILNGSSGGGDFTGDITVIGCHDDQNSFEFCFCGSDSGSTRTVYQTSCMNPVSSPYFTCTTNPCN